MAANNLESFKKIVHEVIPSPSSANRALQYVQTLYVDVSFDGARVLDVGGGAGLHSYYAASCGASSVVCLEPGDSGSMMNLKEAASRVSQSQITDVVQFVGERLQNYRELKRNFDIIIFHNSINHMDETACATLRTNQSSVTVYRGIFKTLATLANPNAIVVIADCSSENFFAKLNLKNPFAPSIEWFKHQPPDVWIDLARHGGFEHTSTRWIAPARLGKFGRVVLSNKVCTYFLSSYFRIVARRLTEEVGMGGQGNFKPSQHTLDSRA